MNHKSSNLPIYLYVTAATLMLFALVANIIRGHMMLAFVDATLIFGQLIFCYNHIQQKKAEAHLEVLQANRLGTLVPPTPPPTPKIKNIKF